MATATRENSESRPPSNVPPELVALSHSELLPLEADIEAANGVLKAAKARLKLRRKVMERDGIDLEVFDAARAEFLANANDVRERNRKKAAMLRAFNSPLAHQYDLFDQPEMDTLRELWKFEGFKAGISGADLDNNPHGRGSDGFNDWEEGYKAGQATLIAGLKIREEEANASAPDDAEEAEADENEQVDIEEAIAADEGEPEIEMVADDNVVPFDEDSALLGIEA